jgi:hypothetical protein
MQLNIARWARNMLPSSGLDDNPEAGDKPKPI